MILLHVVLLGAATFGYRLAPTTDVQKHCAAKMIVGLARPQYSLRQLSDGRKPIVNRTIDFGANSPAQQTSPSLPPRGMAMLHQTRH